MRRCAPHALSRALALVSILAAGALPANALERHARRVDDEGNADWSACCTTVSVAYYNNCTGWVWVWSGWSPGEQIGVCYDLSSSNCSPLVVAITKVLTFSPAPSGYGFTGTVSIESACDCAGVTLASQPFLPGTGWNTWGWGLPVPSKFLVRYTWGATVGRANPTGFASDHPLAGPTGPTACGVCFPSTRTVNSLHFGVAGSACPGSTLSDWLCDVEFMHAAGMLCNTDFPVGIEDLSWGRIKSLYD